MHTQTDSTCSDDTRSILEVLKLLNRDLRQVLAQVFGLLVMIEEAAKSCKEIVWGNGCEVELQRMQNHNFHL